MVFFSADVYILVLFLQMFTYVTSVLHFTQTDFYCKQQSVNVSATKNIYYGLAEVSSWQIKVQNFPFFF